MIVAVLKYSRMGNGTVRSMRNVIHQYQREVSLCHEMYRCTTAVTLDTVDKLGADTPYASTLEELEVLMKYDPSEVLEKDMADGQGLAGQFHERSHGMGTLLKQPAW